MYGKDSTGLTLTLDASLGGLSATGYMGQWSPPQFPPASADRRAWSYMRREGDYRPQLDMTGSTIFTPTDEAAKQRLLLLLCCYIITKMPPEALEETLESLKEIFDFHQPTATAITLQCPYTLTVVTPGAPTERPAIVLDEG